VAVGPVSTFAEAARTFGSAEPQQSAPRLGEHTDVWRAALGLAGHGTT
jgi:hypothetical protein